ncbi:hypothetical protein FRX31_029280 [Thalictrum thalictroides]|uniref:Uncharacterized protein n=1 Tax=Thalictrum thalictroides TaxID=46969 RepID=A0A7J6VAD5_THATH|nr:hypothetical protein FRX31_029280 [Thalictrum thalictroides]
MPNQLFTPWQQSNLEDNLNVKKNNAEVKSSQSREQTSSDVDMTQHGSCCENREQPVGYLQEHIQLQSQLKDGQLKRHDEQNPHQFSERGGLQGSEQNLIEFGEQDRVHPQNQHQYPKSQELYNQQTPAAEPENGNEVPIDMVLDILPQLDEDGFMQYQMFINKLKIKAQAAENSQKVYHQQQTQSRTLQQQQQVKMPSHSSSQLADSNPFSLLHQKGHRAPSDPTQVPTLATEVKSDSSFPATKSNAQQRESEHQSNSHSQGMHANHVSSTNLVNQKRDLPTMQGPTKQEQQHIHHQPTSYSMYGANISNYHTHPYSVGASSTSLKPQNQDSQSRFQFIQAFFQFNLEEQLNQ